MFSKNSWAQNLQTTAVTGQQQKNSAIARQHLPRSQKKEKENPAKGRVSRLLVGRVALFPLRGEALLGIEFDSRFLLGKSPRISWLTDLNGLPSHVEANSSQDLAPHTPGEGLVAFFFYALDYPPSHWKLGPD